MLAQFDNPSEEESIVIEKFRSSQEFCDRLMIFFKLQNMQMGVNAMQALWVHHRLRAVDITFNDVPMTIDVMNLIISGDLEVAYLTLAYMVPDDGSLPYHWLTAERIGFIKNEIGKFLGWE